MAQEAFTTKAISSSKVSFLQRVERDGGMGGREVTRSNDRGRGRRREGRREEGGRGWEERGRDGREEGGNEEQ